MAGGVDRCAGEDGNRCRASRFDRGGRSRRTIHRRTRRFFGHAAQAQSGGSTVIVAAHAAAKGLVSTLFEAMAAAHERPAGFWHAEWNALPSLFGLVSGALREAQVLAEGLVVDADRMRANIDLTHGLLFADAAAARLGARLGRETAHRLVEHAAEEVRQTSTSLGDVLARIRPCAMQVSTWRLRSTLTRQWRRRRGGSIQHSITRTVSGHGLHPTITTAPGRSHLDGGEG